MPLKWRRRLNAVGGVRAGDNTNYTDQTTGGYQTMAGTARVDREIWIPANQFYGFSGSVAGGGTLYDAGSMISASMDVSIGGSIFANTDQASTGIPIITPSVDITGSPTFANAQFPVPTDRATSGSVSIRPVWTSKDANATSGSVFVFVGAVAYISASAEVRTAASVSACATYNYTNANTFHETDLGNVPSFGANDVMGIVTLMHDQTDAADTAGSGVAFLGVKLRYVSDRLGASTS